MTIATPGSPEYLQSILRKISDTHPDLPLDPVIFQSLLLCLVAGRYHESHGQCSQTDTRSKNLILRTKEEDVGMVVNIVAMVSGMWSFIQNSIVGTSCRRISCVCAAFLFRKESHRMSCSTGASRSLGVWDAFQWESKHFIPACLCSCVQNILQSPWYGVKPGILMLILSLNTSVGMPDHEA